MNNNFYHLNTALVCCNFMLKIQLIFCQAFTYYEYSFQNANTEFLRERNSDGGGAKRDSMLSDLAAAHDAYMELLGNLEEGSTVSIIYI